MNEDVNGLCSVIVPVHNSKDYLNDCVASILRNSYSCIEIILVENGSTDGSKELCDEISKNFSQVRVVHYPAMGVSAARNKGILLAQGDFICFVDADDMVSDEYIRYMRNIMVSESVDIVVCKGVVPFSNASLTKAYRDLHDTGYNIITGDSALVDLLTYQTAIGCYSKMFSKDYIRNIKLQFEEKLFVGEGFNFNVDAFRGSSRVASSNTRIYYYRVDNANSAMTKFNVKKLQNGLKAMDLIRYKLVDYQQPVLAAYSYAYWHTCFDFLMDLSASGQALAYPNLYTFLIEKSKRGCHSIDKLDLSFKDKFKVMCASVNPKIAAKVFNILRKRKFTK